MDIIGCFRNYIRMATNKYPSTIKYHTEELLNKKFSNECSNTCFISVDEIKELAGDIIQGLDGLKKSVDKYSKMLDKNEQSFADDMGIVSRKIEESIIEEIKVKYKVESYSSDINESGIIITKI